MSYQVGKNYLILCAELEWKEDNRIYYVPVIGLLHSDPAFNFPNEHFHIDGRFEVHPRIAHQFQIVDGYTSVVLLTEGTGLYEFKSFLQLPLKCVRSETGLTVPPDNEKYWTWYQTYIGKSCKGNKCPHMGTEMIEEDGKLKCPLHALCADIKTLKIILPDRSKTLL